MITNTVDNVVSVVLKSEDDEEGGWRCGKVLRLPWQCGKGWRGTDWQHTGGGSQVAVTRPGAGALPGLVAR